MIEYPQISVLVNVYNGSNYIHDCIKSILDQSFVDFELIVIDDGSTDDTKQIVLSFDDNRIKYYYQENSGISNALNFGLKISRGKYIAKLDADDFAYKDRLKIQFQFMENNADYIVCGCFADVISEDGNFIYTFKVPTGNYEIKYNMQKFNCIIHSGSFYLRSKAIEIGGYDTLASQHFEDYLFFSKMVKLGGAYNIALPLITYRLNINSVTTKNYNFIYKKLVRNIINRGYMLSSEKSYLDRYKKKYSNLEIKTANYLLLLSRLIIKYQGDYQKSKGYFISSFRINPFNLNLVFTFFWVFYYKFIKDE